MTRSLPRLALASLLVLAPAARADEVTLKDGRTLYGASEQRGTTLVIATRDGDVTVERGEVVRVRTGADLRVELLGLASRCGQRSPFSCLHLAHTARDWCLQDDMWAYLDRALGQRDMPQDVRSRLEEFVATLEPELLPSRFRKSSGPIQAREILLALGKRTSIGREAAAARVLAGLKDADGELRLRARALHGAHQRAVANEALWLRTEVDANRRFVLRTAVFDDDADVRRRMIALAIAAGAA